MSDQKYVLDILGVKCRNIFMKKIFEVSHKYFVNERILDLEAEPE